jgi:hypothetical protein
LEETLDLIKQQIDDCQKELTWLCKEHFPKQYERLQTIPGVKEHVATAIIAETGVETSSPRENWQTSAWLYVTRMPETSRVVSTILTTNGL